METEKIVITRDMLESFTNMLTSSDGDTGKLALSVLENRDKTDKESEENFIALRHAIISNNICFPKEDAFVIRCEGKILIVNGKMNFNSHADALKNLSMHFTKFIGVSPKRKALEDIYKRNNRRFGYSPDFSDKMKRWVEEKIDHELLRISLRNGEYSSYFLALKRMFKGGRELRDFLIKENIVQITKL